MLKLDLHIHSKYSFDSIMGIKEILKVASKRLDGIAITDHNTLEGAIEATKLNQNPNFIVIQGSEISTEFGDLLGLFLTEEIKSREAFEVVDKIHEQGGIAVLAHPYKRRGEYPMKLMKRIDAIEGFNARIEDKNSLHRAWKLSREHHLPLIAGSDAHFPFEIGRGITIFENLKSVEDMKKAILKGKTRMAGRLSSPYVEPLSQLVRSFKEKNPRVLAINGILKSALVTYQIIKKKDWLCKSLSNPTIRRKEL